MATVLDKPSMAAKHRCAPALVDVRVFPIEDDNVSDYETALVCVVWRSDLCLIGARRGLVGRVVVIQGFRLYRKMQLSGTQSAYGAPEPVLPRCRLLTAILFSPRPSTISPDLSFTEFPHASEYSSRSRTLGRIFFALMCKVYLF